MKFISLFREIEKENHKEELAFGKYTCNQTQTTGQQIRGNNIPALNPQMALKMAKRTLRNLSESLATRFSKKSSIPEEKPQSKRYSISEPIAPSSSCLFFTTTPEKSSYPRHPTQSKKPERPLSNAYSFSTSNLDEMAFNPLGGSRLATVIPKSPIERYFVPYAIISQNGISPVGSVEDLSSLPGMISKNETRPPTLSLVIPSSNENQSFHQLENPGNAIYGKITMRNTKNLRRYSNATLSMIPTSKDHASLNTTQFHLTTTPPPETQSTTFKVNEESDIESETETECVPIVIDSNAARSGTPFLSSKRHTRNGFGAEQLSQSPNSNLNNLGERFKTSRTQKSMPDLGFAAQYAIGNPYETSPLRESSSPAASVSIQLPSYQSSLSATSPNRTHPFQHLSAGCFTTLPNHRKFPETISSTWVESENLNVEATVRKLRSGNGSTTSLSSLLEVPKPSKGKPRKSHQRSISANEINLDKRKSPQLSSKQQRQSTTPVIQLAPPTDDGMRSWTYSPVSERGAELRATFRTPSPTKHGFDIVTPPPSIRGNYHSMNLPFVQLPLTPPDSRGSETRRSGEGSVYSANWNDNRRGYCDTDFF